MRKLRWPRFWLALWGLAILVVVVLSLIPPPDMPSQTPQHTDKLLHLLAYFTLAFSAVQIFSGKRWLFGIALGLTALGIALEYAQGSLVPHLRMFDPADALANTLGVLLGISTAPTPLAGIVRWMEDRDDRTCVR